MLFFFLYFVCPALHLICSIGSNMPSIYYDLPLDALMELPTAEVSVY